MEEFAPLKILEWMWQMRWGRLLVMVTISAIGLAGALQIIGWQYQWTWATAILLLVALLFTYLQCRTGLRRKIDDLITEGEQIRYMVNEIQLGSLTESHWKWMHDKVSDWYTSVTKIIVGTRYERQWLSNAGLEYPDDEFGIQGFDWSLKVWRGQMKLRLKRLEDIRNTL